MGNRQTGRQVSLVLALIPAFLLLYALPVCAKPSDSKTSAKVKFGKTKIDAWVLKQRHLDLGDITVSVAREAVKIDIEKIGCTLLAVGPDWSVYYYRPSEKSVWLGTPEKIALGYIANPYVRPVATKRLPVQIIEAGQRKKIAGYMKNQIVELLGKGMLGQLHYNEYSADMPGKKHKIFRTTGDIAVAPGGAEVVCRLYGLPKMDNVPIYVRENYAQEQTYAEEHEKSRYMPYFPQHLLPRDLRTGPRIAIQTISSKKTRLNAELFEPPTGFTVRQDILDVTYSKQAKEQVTDLIDAVGFVDKANKSKTGAACGK